MNDITFQRGPYGEIFPPPLLSHVTPDEAWKRYYAFNLSLGIKLDGPQNDAEKPVWYNLAAVYCHQIRLRDVIGGNAKGETPVEAALRTQIEAGELLSIRPVGLEHHNPKSYAPVLKRLEISSWQFGLPGRGRSTRMEAHSGEAIEKAQMLYTTWQKEEAGHQGL